jgi:hypothetical protein
MIIVAGDSFVYGSELTDPTQTFPKLLAKEYEDISWPGYANDSIARTTIERCEQGEINGVIVSWTFAGRYEFRFNYDTKQKKSPWYAINSWTIKKDIDSIKDEFVTNNPKVLFAQKQTIERARQTGIADFADVFYKHVGISEYWEVYTTLKEIVYLQNYLTVKQIPFVFTCADTSILYNNTVSNADSVILSLVNQVDNSKWFWFPTGTNPHDTQNPRGFYQWAIENKYPIGTTHPLEPAHQAAADLMKGTFNELVKKHIQ